MRNAVDADLWNAGERQSGGRKEVQHSMNYIKNAMQKDRRFRKKQNATE